MVHPEDIDQRGKVSSIKFPRGTIVDSKYQYNPNAEPGKYGGTLDPSNRKVTQEDIKIFFKDIKFDKNGIGQIGKITNTIYYKDGSTR
ncbi:hypothetical protein [Mesonia sp. K4-1]|uniref:hypothetical protein n=1 Tax=Mesonia sp. K4-1 TaxID=2602760 RepID=UPI0011CA95DA|nr:hypothetical protein [Mesonia sp. K4-1]TXK74424.1 hypothetical protein FT986_11560 [Mesonia sp. K4-1]